MQARNEPSDLAVSLAIPFVIAASHNHKSTRIYISFIFIDLPATFLAGLGGLASSLVCERDSNLMHILAVVFAASTLPVIFDPIVSVLKAIFGF